MLDAREQALAVSVQNRVQPVDRERALGTKNELMLSSDFYADGFAQALQPSDSRPEPVRDDRFRLGPGTTPSVTATSSGTEIELPQIGIGFGIGLVLAFGLSWRCATREAASSRTDLGRRDPVATETALEPGRSRCAWVTSRRGRRAAPVSQELLAPCAERARPPARAARARRPAHPPADRSRPRVRKALVDAGLDRPGRRRALARRAVRRAELGAQRARGGLGRAPAGSQARAADCRGARRRGRGLRSCASTTAAFVSPAPFFAVRLDSPDEAWLAEAPRHPVFRLVHAES